MHILLVSRSFPCHRPGGLEWHSLDVAEGLLAAGHTVTILTTPPPEGEALMPLPPGAEVAFCGATPGAYDARWFTELLRTGRGLIRRIAPDVVHAQGFAGVALADLMPARVPLVTTIHGTLWSETPLRRGGSPALYWRYKHRVAFLPLWRRFLRRARHLVVDSRFTRRELRRESSRLGCKPTVVPLGIDLGRFPVVPRADARRELGIDPSAVLLATLGRLEPIKGPMTVLESFLRIASADPRAVLAIGGVGSQLPELMRRARESGQRDRVRFLGALDAPGASRLLSGADLFLNADMGAPAFGLTNAEALCQGTPVLTTPSGAHREVVSTPADGCVAPPRQWAAELQRLLAALPEPDATCDERLQRARRRFAREVMIGRLLSVYQGAIAG